MRNAVVGAGFTGLAAAMTSGAPVYEQADQPGGICRSYYLRCGEDVVLDRPPPDDSAYRFEVGGGHWLFGGDAGVLTLLAQIAPLASYERHAVVRLGRRETTVPYPLQNHVNRLGPALARTIAAERTMSTERAADNPTLQAWLESSFGRTLCDLFFTPFNRRYTAGLSDVVAAEDEYKSPRGPATPASGEGGRRAGYNAVFRYPVGGLGALAGAMAERCDVRYGRRLVGIDRRGRSLQFADGTEQGYDTLISTLPLRGATELAEVAIDAEPDPYTSVLVLNIGAARGPNCPEAHWQYEPDSSSGFHRLGFYSNVDQSFLPKQCREAQSHVAMYVERAFAGGHRLSDEESGRYCDSVVVELQERGYIGDVEVVDPSWVDVAYTWRIPGSRWRQLALSALAADGILQVGRYAAWHFQGIVDSVRDGLAAGQQLRAGVLAPRASGAW